MKILLILTNDTRFPDGKEQGETKMPYAYAPTTLTTLASLVPPELDAEIELVDEGVEVLPENFYADLVGISVATPNASRAYRIAKNARKKGMTVVMGGFHPTLLPGEAQQHADAIVVGYGEKSWPRLLRDFQNNRLQKVYWDLSTHTFQNNMPIPRRDLLKWKRYALPATLEATRGCGNRCRFCVIPAAYNSSQIVRPIPQVIQEVESMNSRKIVFLDTNPTENLPYAQELYRALKPLNIRWFSTATVKAAADNEWLKSAAESGCRGVLIGFESLNQSALQVENKGFNKVWVYKDLVHKLHDHGIIVIACFIFGFDDDDPTIFERTADFVDETCIDLVQYNVLTPFPGTPSFNFLKQQNRIFQQDWSLYDGKHVVFRPVGMTTAELQKGIYWIWKRTYAYRSISKRILGSRISPFFSLVVNLGFKFLGSFFFED